MISKEVQAEIRGIFESPHYYGRPLSSDEVEEIAISLISFAEIVVSVAKRKYSEN